MWQNATRKHTGTDSARAYRSRTAVQFVYATSQLIWTYVLNIHTYIYTDSKTLANIQTNALRFILKVEKACPIAGLFGESGWVPHSMSTRFNILRFRRRIMQMGEERMTKRIYLWSHSLAGENFKNWAWKTQNLLDTIKDFGGLLSTDEL